MYDYDPPEWLDAEQSLDNLVTCIRNSLQYWLDVHTNPQAWAQSWDIEGDPQYLLSNQPILSNDWFTFDLKEECIRLYWLDNMHLFIKCDGCGMILDSGWDCEECDDPDYSDLEDDDEEEFIQWMDDMGFSDTGSIPDYIIAKAMTGKGFEVYQDALNGTIAGVVEEVEEALKLFDDATNGEELLSAAMIASSILHVNGNILEDYGEYTGLDYRTVCTYRDDGLTALFDKEEIKEYINN